MIFPLDSPDTLPAPPGPPDSPGLPTALLPAPPPEQEPKMHRVSDHVRNLHHRSLNINQFQCGMAMMISHHRMGDNGNGPDRVIEYILAHRRHKRHQYHQFNPIVLQEPATELDEDPGSSGRQQRSRSRERAPVHVSPSADEESAAVEPQGRVSDCSRSPQRKESPQRQKGKKTTAEVKKQSDLPKAKKHKPMDSDEDDEVPQNEPGTSSNTQPPVPVLPLPSGARRGDTTGGQIRSTTSLQGPSISTTSTSSQRTSTSTSSEDESTDNDDEHGEGESGPSTQSARSHDSAGTALYPDLHVLTNDEHWTMTPEAHKYAAAAGLFCFVTTENGEQQDVCNLTAMPCVQRSLCLDEVTDDSSSAQVGLPKKELTVKPETCWNAVWPLVEKQQQQGPTGDLVHERKRQLRKYEDTTYRVC